MGVYPRGIFVPTTAFAAARRRAHLGSGLYLCPVAAEVRFRQGPSSLYTFPRRARAGLARYCRHLACAAVPPTLTPFTPGVSAPGAQALKSLASTDFATRAWVRPVILHTDCGPGHGVVALSH